MTPAVMPDPSDSLLARRPPREDFRPPSHEETRLGFVEAAMSAPCGREKATLAALAMSAPRVICTYATLAARTGGSVSTVQRHVEELEALGLVEVFERVSAKTWRRRPAAGDRSRSKKPLGFVLRLPDMLSGRTYSTRHPSDDVPTLREVEECGWGLPRSKRAHSIHC